MAKTPAREAQAKNKAPPAKDEELTPFERMRRLTKAVVNVPKTEAIKPDRMKRKT